MLRRRCFLGAAVRDTSEGIEVTRVFEGSMAARAGLEVGDVITGFATPTPDRAALVSACRALVGERSALTYRRGEQSFEASVEYVPFPLERVPGAELVYGESGGLRTILAAPPGADALVCFLPGIDYASIDFALREAAPAARFLTDLCQLGLATFRIERPGLGDSPGEPELAFEEEQLVYRDAIGALERFERVVLFGHSVGGMHAPMLADLADALVVYGTSKRRWSRCLREGRERQGRLRGLEYDAPEGWPEERGPRFHEELESADLEAAWSAVSAPHLVLIGEYDWVVGEDEQRELGGETRFFEGLDHAFTRHPTLEASFEDFGRGGYDARVARACAEWIG